jgi:N-acetylglutamate synthase-like GNAT family acetyltransferase
MTHTDLLDYIAKNSPVKITTNDGQEFVIANRDSIVADAGCAHILPKGEQKIVLVSMIAITSARSMANGTELAER